MTNTNIKEAGSAIKVVRNVNPRHLREIQVTSAVRYIKKGSIDRFGTLQVGCTSETQIRKKKTSEDSLRLWSIVF